MGRASLRHNLPEWVGSAFLLLLSCIPVDSPTAHVRKGIVSEAHARTEGRKSEGAIAPSSFYPQKPDRATRVIMPFPPARTAKCALNSPR